MKNAIFLGITQMPYSSACNLLKRQCARIFPQAMDVCNCPNTSAFIPTLRGHIKDHDVFVLALEPNAFLEGKALLTQSLGKHCLLDEDIFHRQPIGHTSAADASFPAKATIFAAENGLYNGFALRSGHQHILFLLLQSDWLLRQEQNVAAYLQTIVWQQEQPRNRSVEEAFEKLSGGLRTNIAPILPDGVLPFLARDGFDFPDAETDYFAQNEPLPVAEPPAPAAQIEVADLQAFARKREETARNIARTENMAYAFAQQELLCALLLPHACGEMADILRHDVQCGDIFPITSEKNENLEHPQQLITMARRCRMESGGDYCAAVSPPKRLHDGSFSVTIALCGDSDYAQLKQFILPAEESVADHAASLAQMVLTELFAYQSKNGVPSKRDRLQSNIADIADETVRRHKKVSRALSVLAVFSLIACFLFTTFLSRGFGAAEGTADLVPVHAATEQQNETFTIPEPELRALDLDVATQYQSLALNDSTMPGDLIATLVQQFIDVLSQLIVRALQDALQNLPDLVQDIVNVTGSTAESSTRASTAPQTSPSTVAPNTPSKNGVWYIVTYGVGHGVGLSQEGAVVYAEQGSNYSSIIKHYYPGVEISTNTSRPALVSHEGVLIAMREYLARIACKEIGYPNRVPDEAFKAQVICAFTIAMSKNFVTTETNHHIVSTADWAKASAYHAKTYELVDAVIGKYVSYNNKTAETLYFASSAGKTANASYVWSGTAASYLKGGVKSKEAVKVIENTFTTAEIKELVDTYNKKPENASKKITLGTDPGTWFEILQADDVGYIEKIRVGDKTLLGGELRSKLFGNKVIRSHCATLQWIPN